MVSNAKSYRPNPRAMFRVIDDEAVILHLDAGLYYGLNPVGTRIWQLLGESASVAQICEAIVAEFDVSADEAGADVASFLEALVENDLAAVAEEAGLRS